MDDIKRILVIDIETTGFSQVNDSIVEMAIVSYNYEKNILELVFDEIIRDYNFNSEKTNSWIFRNSSLMPDEVLSAHGIDFYREKIQSIFDGFFVTAFNLKFEQRFLAARRFKINLTMPCIMEQCKLAMQIPSARYGFKNPSFEEAWKHYFPHIPLKRHRAKIDAINAAFMLKKMIERKDYKITNE